VNRGIHVGTISNFKTTMLKNYLKTALRNILREKASTLINIAGLTMGITCSLVLFLLIRHLSSFDNFHAKRDRIYRVVHQSDGNQGKNYTPGVPSVLPDAFRQDFPEAEEVVFMSYRAESMVTIPQPAGEPKRYTEEAGVVFTSTNFFKVFDRSILIGDKIGGLDDPNEAIISKRWALKYFDKEDVVGEVVKFDTNEYKITAVMADFPQNTDFPFDLMLSYPTVKKGIEQNGWNSIWSDEQCYFLLKEGEPISKVESRMGAFTEKYIGDDNPNNALFSIQPLAEIHFDDRFGTFTYNTIERSMLVTFGVIALILIITACINFINLATAEAIKRSKEVGIRKSLGGTRWQLIGQFLGETTLVTVMSMLASLALAQLALTILNPFLELQLSLGLASDWTLWIFLTALTLVIAVLSGLYPAFIVSGFNPVLALKNLVSNKTSSGYNLRRALVITQFFISQFFIVGTLVVINQMEYFLNKDLGFKKDAIIVVPVPEREEPADGKNTSKMRTLRDEMLRLSGVANASLNSAPPSSGNVSGTHFTIEGKEDDFRTQVKQIDGNYLDVFELKIVAGQNVEDGDTAKGFLVNEKLAYTVGLEPQQIVGKTIEMWGRKRPVVGVVKDFHTRSLREPIEPTVMMNRVRGYETLSLQVNQNQIKPVVDKLKASWEAAYPEHIFEYEFLDQQIAEFYESEQRMSTLLGVFSCIAIFIGCLGLFGLATFMANQKTKEIGVRKVLGASVESIVLLFSKEYLRLILIGFFLAAPLSWYVMNKFLDGFAYKITIGPETFLIGLAATLFIAMFTVGYRSLRAALVNPSNSLRSE
jgi:putative ABC transport system permease protein